MEGEKNFRQRGTSGTRTPKWGCVWCDLVTAGRQEDWKNECGWETWERRLDLISCPLLWPPKLLGSRSWLAFPHMEERHNLACHLQELPILMYLFFCMTLGEFGGIDAYFKSQRQELTYDMLYTEAIFLTTISQKLTQKFLGFTENTFLLKFCTTLHFHGVSFF